jgi:hypothetical protein
MQSVIGGSLAALVGVAGLYFAVNALSKPRALAGFGIPDTPTQDPVFHAWLRVKGVRDLAAAASIFIVLAVGTPALLGGLMLATALIPIGDAAIVLHSKGPKSIAYGVHAATAAVVLVAALLLLTA